MAYNAKLILHDNDGKMIIWAHDAHVAKKGIYNNEVGGTGGYISRMFPGEYFVLGTGTATGTFAATKEGRDTYTNPMSAYPLAIPAKNSWENYFNQILMPSFYCYPAEFNPGNAHKPLRFIGYGPDSSPATSDQTNLSDLFDAFIFIKNTHAATPLK
jgi:erythromycin esterase